MAYDLTVENPLLSPETAAHIAQLTGARKVIPLEKVQSLWSGYGAIVRVQLDEGPPVIVKQVRPPHEGQHPRGWHSSWSHERKLNSYRVEQAFYTDYAGRLGGRARVPSSLALDESPGSSAWLFVFEDLDAAGFPQRSHNPTGKQIVACIDWLAQFHATFLGTKPEGLWKVGSYWHLATRPEELEMMGDLRLKSAAARIDQHLNECPYQTLIHGDAKAANFCFPRTDGPVAALDFQYVGGGVGVKDLAYLLSSCLDERGCEQHADIYLDLYFERLGRYLAAYRPEVPAQLVEQNWRELYAFAWADFVRFLLGWAPDHFKLHGYSRQMTELCLNSLTR